MVTRERSLNFGFLPFFLHVAACITKIFPENEVCEYFRLSTFVGYLLFSILISLKLNTYSSKNWHIMKTFFSSCMDAG